MSALDAAGVMVYVRDYGVRPCFQIPREFNLSRSEFPFPGERMDAGHSDSASPKRPLWPFIGHKNFAYFCRRCCPSGLAQDSGRRDGGAGPVEANYIRRTDAEMLERSFPSLRIRPANNGDIPAMIELEHKSPAARLSTQQYGGMFRKP